MSNFLNTHVIKITREKDGKYYISRGTKRYEISIQKTAYEALVGAKQVHEGDDLLEHWIDGKWQSRQKS